MERVKWWTKKRLPKYLFLLAIAAVLVLWLVPKFSGASMKDMDLATLQQKSDTKEVEEASFHSSDHEVIVELKNGEKYKVAYPAEYDDELTTRLIGDGVAVNAKNMGFFGKYSFFIIFFPAMIGLTLLPFLISKVRSSMMVRGRRVTNVPEERYSDVQGAELIIEQLGQLHDYLKNPAKYEKAGVRAPRGFLMYGPPGNGKTLLARAIAGEAGVPFYAYSGSDFADKFVGEGAGRVRAAMQAARDEGYDQPVIVFIDEIDKCGAKRDEYDSTGSHVEILNQLLVELDGFLGRESKVVVIGATNRKEVLDDALLRPGRLTKHVYLDNPDMGTREKLLKQYATTFTSKEVSFVRIARRTAGMSAAQVKEVCNNAGLRAILGGDENPVVDAHFEAAMVEVALGLERPGGLVTEDREVVIAHESGHALAAHFTKGAPVPDEITIIPRGATGGATWFLPNERVLTTRDEVMAMLVAIMGGRAAEKIKYGSNFSVGAAHDLERGTQLALEAICCWGLGDSVYRTVPLDDWSDDPKGYEISDEIDKWIREAEEKATDILLKHSKEFDALGVALDERETVSGADLVQLTASFA